MNRIARTFTAARDEGRVALVGYMTAGDPNPGASEEAILRAVRSGLDVLELGVPFSDPTADGPVIQAASHRALAAGMTLESALRIVARVRMETADLPIVLFGYANPFLAYGVDRLCRAAGEAGADGLLVVDVPLEERGEFLPAVAGAGMSWIPLVAPSTPVERARRIIEGVDGFVYYVMVKGVTGARSSVGADVADHVQALRGITDLPIAVGFGVSTADQARVAARGADGVVVGSALVSAAAEGGERLEALVQELRAALAGRR